MPDWLISFLPQLFPKNVLVKNYHQKDFMLQQAWKGNSEYCKFEKDCLSLVKFAVISAATLSV